MKLEIDVFDTIKLPDAGRSICFCSEGDWYQGSYNHGWFDSHSLSVTVKDVSHWFYLPEMDDLE